MQQSLRQPASLLLSFLQRLLSISAISIPRDFAPRVPAGAAGASWRIARYRRSESRSDTSERTELSAMSRWNAETTTIQGCAAKRLSDDIWGQ